MIEIRIHLQSIVTPPLNKIVIETTDAEYTLIEYLFNNNTGLGNDDFISRFSIRAEIIDLAGGSSSIFADYQDYSNDTFTISKPISNQPFAMGWNLLAPPLDQNIYEGCAWSSLIELTSKSANQGGAPQEFPDFTRGNWVSTKPFNIKS